MSFGQILTTGLRTKRVEKSVDTKIWRTRKEEEYRRQYDYRKRKSKLYQDTIFTVYGAEYLLVNTLESVLATTKRFNAAYGDSLSPRHGAMMLMIKHWCLSRFQFFRTDDLKLLPIENFAGFFTGPKNTTTKSMVKDLIRMHFLNHSGRTLTPTTRLKQFCIEFNKTCEDLRK